MIQRVQSIYLLITTALTSLMLFLPFAEILTNQQIIYVFNHSGIFDSQIQGEDGYVLKTLSLSIIIAIIAIISFVNIFLYKKRTLQIRLCNYNILLQIGILALLGFYFYKIFKQLENPTIHYSIALILPLIASILIFLARKAIIHDEKLIRSVDRIR